MLYNVTSLNPFNLLRYESIMYDVIHVNMRNLSTDLNLLKCYFYWSFADSEHRKLTFLVVILISLTTNKFHK